MIRRLLGGKNIKTIFFDTETTGLNSKSCRIIELAMLIDEDGKEREYDKFIRINEPLPHNIIEITGITDNMLKEKGVDEEIVARDLIEELKTTNLMIAHNTQFDLLFIYELLKKYYPDEVDDILENIDWLDTLTILRDRKNYPHKLVDCIEYYGLEKVNFHKALDDTKALNKLYGVLKNERDDVDEYINIFGYNPKYGVNGERFSFIEYKSQPYHNRGKLDDDEILPFK